MQEMYYEARGQYDQAERLLTEQLADTPESQMLVKRQVALEKTKGNIAGAIETLRKYVDIFQTDREAWEELGELYLQAWLPLTSLHILLAPSLYAWNFANSKFPPPDPAHRYMTNCIPALLSALLMYCGCASYANKWICATGADVPSGGHML